MIDVSGLTVARGGRPILQDCAFHAERGGVLAILGSNGVGKTTLLDALIGVLRPSAGSVRLDGPTGFVPQLVEVPFSYSVQDVVLMGRARQVGLFGAPKASDYAAMRRALSLLDITDLEERTFNDLSGGQRQMVMIAQALCSDCEILVLDEPCAALDYRNQTVVIDVLQRLSEAHGLTVVFTTHAPQHALAIASHVLLLYDRASHDSGATHEVLTEDALSRLYGVPIAKAYFSGQDRFTFALVSEAHSGTDSETHGTA